MAIGHIPKWGIVWLEDVEYSEANVKKGGPGFIDGDMAGKTPRRRLRPRAGGGGHSIFAENNPLHSRSALVKPHWTIEQSTARNPLPTLKLTATLENAPAPGGPYAK